METLGTPEPSFTSYDYNTITVTWPKVQKADGQYVVSAKYENQNQELVKESNISITTQEGDDNTIKCIITNPDGYNDAEKSGKKIKLTVTAKNGSKGQTSNQPIDVCTLGPALSDLQVVKPVQDEVITIKWNKIQGAAGYKIVRNFYNDVKDPSQYIEDYYYFDGNSVTANGESVAKKRVEVRDNGDGTIQLTDKYCEPESENTYETNQSRIAWGLPYEYIVLPVKENGSPSSVPSYSNINKLQKVGVTKGFGLYVSAEKSESTSKQVVTWTKPNENADGPVLYYRVAGSDENRWTKLSEEFGNGLGFNPNKKTEAYEYLIAYNRGGSELTKVPLSLLNDSEKGGLETAEINYSYTGEAEKANKGYLLAVDFSIRAGNEYSEVVEWEPWDYSKRAIGPDGGAVLSIKNYNIGTDWTQFATLDENLNCLDQNLGANLTNTVVNKRTITQVSLKPQKMMDTTKANSITKGQLMVLRDARHYYALTFTRNGNTYELGKDDSIYGYREINNYEYIKMVMALFSNPMEYIGELDDKNDSLPDGSVAYIHRGSLSHDFDFTYTDYAPEFNLPSGVSAKSQISINCSGVASRNLAGIAGYTKTISSTTIKTKRLDEKIQMPDCYEGSITFELKYESGTNKAVINGITYQDDSRKVFVPFRMYNHNTNYYQDASYGWWN